MTLARTLTCQMMKEPFLFNTWQTTPVDDLIWIHLSSILDFNRCCDGSISLITFCLSLKSTWQDLDWEPPKRFPSPSSLNVNVLLKTCWCLTDSDWECSWRRRRLFLHMNKCESWRKSQTINLHSCYDCLWLKIFTVMKFLSRRNTEVVPSEEAKIFVWIQSERFMLSMHTWERTSVLDEACNTICHVFVGGPFLSTLSHSLRAFCRQMDDFTQKDLYQNIYSVCKSQKRSEIQLKYHSKLIKPDGIFFVKVNRQLFRL